MKNSKNPLYLLFLCLFAAISIFSNRYFQKQPLSEEILDKSIEASCTYLSQSQVEGGNFIYEQNFITNEIKNDDNQVRQAGALWGLAIAYKEHPDIVAFSKVKQGLSFYYDNMKTLPDSSLMPIYKGETNGSTGSLALIILAHIELLTSPHLDQDRDLIKKYLDGLVRFLITLRQDNGQFYGRYSYVNGKGGGSPSPYYDGEALLALSKAAKYCGYEELVPFVLESAESMYKVNVEDALQKDRDSNTTKGFYQWGSMSFYEIHTTGWSNSDVFAQRAIDLAYWMIDVHKTLRRTRNTAYAYEGITVSYQLAKLTGDKKAENKFRKVINKGMAKLIGWQVGGPIPNNYLKRNTPTDTSGYGGIMNKRNDPWIRIDVVQHQLHAMVLARSFLFGESKH